jgi:hypothetical protein
MSETGILPRSGNGTTSSLDEVSNRPRDRSAAAKSVTVAKAFSSPSIVTNELTIDATAEAPTRELIEAAAPGEPLIAWPIQ